MLEAARRAAVGLGLSVAVVAGTPAPSAAAAADSGGIEKCDALVRDRPRELDSYRCYDLHAQAVRDNRAALERLEALVARDAANPHARLVLGRVLGARDAERALGLMSEAIEEYRRSGDASSEAWARAYRLHLLVVRQRFDEARSEAESASALAEAQPGLPLKALVAVERARMHLLLSDEGRVWGILRQLEREEGFGELAPAFRCGVFDLLSIVAGNSGLYDTVLGYARRIAELADEHGLRFWRAVPARRISEAALHLAESGRLPREQARRLVVEALALAREPIEVLPLRRQLARLSEGEEAVRLLSDLAREAGDEPFFAYQVYVDLAFALFDHDASRQDEAFEHLRRALDAARRTREPRPVVTVLAAVARLRLLAGPLDQAVADSLEAADAIEHLHGMQSGEHAGMLIFASYAWIYYELADAILSSDGGLVSAEADLATAFTVSERLRARELVDHLARVAPARGTASEAAKRRREVLREIAELQLERILEQDSSAAARATREQRLERLEAEEALLRDEPAPEDRDRERGLATLDDARRALGEHEALLSFLVSPGEADGSWAIVVTSEGARAHRIPSRRSLEGPVRFFVGLLRDGGDGTEAGARRLFDDLLKEAFATLPPGITRLVVVPDGPLHGLPFDALRPAPDAPPIVETHEVVLAPSATVWLRLRGSRDEERPASALLLADPEPPVESSARARERWVEAARTVGRLPHAREEARLAFRALDGRGELRLGADAAESYLKQADLSRYRLLHLAAHALLDEADPARSAILLSPGAEGEDGLLQAREVGDLDLGKSLVVLSACRSVEGPVVTGEGVLGLARSFFQARASAVVGGLWPLGDHETAELMALFYRRLAAGDEVATALAWSKRQRRRAGAPWSAWAGLVVLGDGSLAPWSGAPEPAARASQALLLGAAAVALAAAGVGVLRILRWRGRRSRAG